MNSACVGAEDGSKELHTVAVRENKQYRNRTKASLEAAHSSHLWFGSVLRLMHVGRILICDDHE